jgi:REP element-mobilizing transposase RayT
MRKEPFFVGDFVHVFNRGNRKQEIVRDKRDREYFLHALYYFNNKTSIPHMFESIARSNLAEFRWPKEFLEREPLVKIHAFVLKENHFHLILEEIIEGGISEFMRKLSTGMTCRFNKKYDEVGKLFQGSYKARRVDKDNYLQYLSVYIHIKNVFEIYGGGIENAIKNFDDAYEFATNYPYSSLGIYEGRELPASNIISTDWLEEAFRGNEFNEFSKNCLETVGFDEKKLNVIIR